MRGTDYRSTKPLGHARIPDDDEYMALIRKCCEQWGCSYIYISTEDKAILERAKNEFGEKVLYYEEKRFSDANQFEYSVDEVLNYVISKALLAKCDYMFGVINGGTVAALGMNNLRFKDTYIYNNGKYGDEIPLAKRAIRGVKNRTKKFWRRFFSE